MIPERPTLERRILAALDADPPRVPVILGGCGSGRTSLLLRSHDIIGHLASQYIDLERVASTPEECLRAVVEASPFSAQSAERLTGDTATPRAAFERLLVFLDGARTQAGDNVTFLLDEVLELKTFESFPGLRTALRDIIGLFGWSSNRFVLSSRFATRAMRWLKDASAQFEVIHVPPLGTFEVAGVLLDASGLDVNSSDDLARSVHALTDGRPTYTRALVRAMVRARGGDPVAAMAEEMAVEGRLAAELRFCYELRLQRARGYGALKAILGLVAEEEPLTLTEIAQRLRRTPGSTKDYLTWLEDVDLVAARQRRYGFVDPLLRLWVRLHCRSMPPSDEEVAQEVQRYAVGRLPSVEPVLTAVSVPDRASDAGEKPWGIIEID